MQFVFSRGKQNKYIITQMRNIQQTDQGTEHTEGMDGFQYVCRPVYKVLTDEGH